jgi:hypothetical protein
MTRAEALAALKASYAELPPGLKPTVRLFEPADAPGVGRLFYQVYGEGYPVDDPYVPELLIEANRTGRIHTVVAAAPDGSIIGQSALYQSSPPNKRFYEYGQLLVDKGYRGSSAAMRIHQFCTKNLYGQLPGVEAEFGEAVCHHLVSQKMSVNVGYRECGLEVGLMPQAAYAGEGVTGRVSCMLHVRVNEPGAGPLFVPACWRRQVEAILPVWALPRDLGASGPENSAPAGLATELEIQIFAFAGVTRLNVFTPGADFAARVDASLAEAAAGGHAVLELFLNLGSPWAGAAAEDLRRAGFSFGGFVPLWFGTAAPGPDALLAQRFLAPQALADIRAHTEGGAAVAALVLEDMARAEREFGAPAAGPVPTAEEIRPS